MEAFLYQSQLRDISGGLFCFAVREGLFIEMLERMCFRVEDVSIQRDVVIWRLQQIQILDSLSQEKATKIREKVQKK